MSLVAAADTRTAREPRAAGPQAATSAGCCSAFGLLATLLLALAILLILLVSTLIDGVAGPVEPAGWTFVTSDTSSLPERAGVWQGLVGSLILDRVRRRDRPADRDRGRDLPAGVHPRHHGSAAS